MFPFPKKKQPQISEHSELKIAFHDDARYFGIHGRMQVSHKTKGLSEAIIVFVFPDLVTPPHLTPGLMSYIWSKAQAEGYIPHTLLEYGKDAEIVNYTKKEPVLTSEVTHILAHRISTSLDQDVNDIITLLTRPVSMAEAIDLADRTEVGHGVSRTDGAVSEVLRGYMAPAPATQEQQ